MPFLPPNQQCQSTGKATILIIPAVTVADNGTWHDVQLKRSASSGATELSFVTSYKDQILYVAISSLTAKNRNKHMPSAVSSNSSIRVHSSMHLNNLADSVASCISKQSDAYTLLVDAVWRSMEEAGNNADLSVQA